MNQSFTIYIMFHKLAESDSYQCCTFAYSIYIHVCFYISTAEHGSSAQLLLPYYENSVNGLRYDFCSNRSAT